MDGPSPRGKGDALHDRLNQSVRVPAALRATLAAIVVLGGSAFLLGGAILLIAMPQRSVPHPVLLSLLAVLLVGLGCCFLFVGARLWRPASRSGVLIGPRARTICGLLFGAAAIGMGIAAWHADGVRPAVDALGVAFLSFLILRSAASHADR